MNDPVADFLDSIEPDRRRDEARALDALFRRVTGWTPRLWSGSILGYGAYEYRYESGREGTSLATGFSPRKAKISLYIMPGYADFSPILARLGKHSTGAACVYANKLADIDLDVLAELIKAGLDTLAASHTVRPS